MITKQQVLSKISELQAYCVANGFPGNYSGFISPLVSAVESYFNAPPADLKEEIQILITILYNDLAERCTTYERPIGAPLSTNYPKGYNDLTEVFDGDGVFSEILNISNDTFLNGFPVRTETSTGEDGTSSTTIIVENNPIIATWISKINSAHGAEITKIKAIMTFCAECASERTLIALFEDRGKAVRSKEIPDLAKEIYVDMKVKEVIQTFNLNVHIPTYL